LEKRQIEKSPKISDIKNKKGGHGGTGGGGPEKVLTKKTIIEKNPKKRILTPHGWAARVGPFPAGGEKGGG